MDNDAFIQTYHQYKTRVYGFILKMVMDKDQAMELFQYVFVKLWEHRSELKAADSISAYLFTIARNSVYTFWRQCLQRKKLESYLYAQGERVSPSPDLIVEDKDFQAYMFSVVDMLPHRCKEVFLLRYRHHKTYREIAIRLNISEKTVDNQLQKAIAFLRERIGKTGR